MYRVKDYDRKKSLREVDSQGKYILYWMQNAQRIDYNHSLKYGIEEANKRKKPLIVYFGLTDDYPQANIRHYKFMLEGLLEIKKNLEKRGIRFVILKASPEQGAIQLGKDAELILVDKGYLKIERIWRKKLVDSLEKTIIEVDTNLSIPLELVSNKEEYSAATIRRKINKFNIIEEFHLEDLRVKSLDYKLEVEEIRDENMGKILDSLNIDKSISPVESFKGGEATAKELLEDFIENKLVRYNDDRNIPGENINSNLSPYLHFGQISPLYIVNRLKDINESLKAGFIEELIVRRELSFNLVYYNENYDNYKCLPDWAKKTLEEHKDDKRYIVYDLKELEEAKTEDKYWNAAQNQLVKEGIIQGYMRMYWGKKVLEWTESPQVAYERLVYLNNKYALDGRDPNSYAGIAWIFGKHDRAWREREIFGKIRYMNSNGIERKFKMEKYLSQQGL